MSQPTRQAPAGRAYLDLQNRARRERRGTQELLTLYVVERRLARLSASRYAESFVLKGGMLLAATTRADPPPMSMRSPVVSRTTRTPCSSGSPRSPTRPPTMAFEFFTDTAVLAADPRGRVLPGCPRVMDSRVATAVVRFRLDVNFGDPVTPAPRMIALPSLRPDTAPVRVLGYPIETVLAEKLATAIMLGAANTRVRDYADSYTLTGRHDLTHGAVRAALDATARFRGVEIVPLSSVIDELAELREQTYRAYRIALGVDGAELPADFGEVVDAVRTFADPLVRPTAELRWQAASRRWIAST